MAAIGRRRPATDVLRQGLGLGVVTGPTRQAPGRRRRHFVQLPIDWRPQGPERTYGTGAGDEDTGPGGDGLGLTSCEEC
jgi:hypothetical protein